MINELLYVRERGEGFKETRNHGRYKRAWRRHTWRILEQRRMMKTWKETSSSCRRVSSTSNTARKTISGGLKSPESIAGGTYIVTIERSKCGWWDQWRSEKINVMMRGRV